MIFTALILIVIFVVIGVIWIYNSIIAAKISVEETQSTIDVMLKNRCDLIPNLVKVVKKYAAYESTLLQSITETRANIVNEQTLNTEKIQKNTKLTNELKTLFAVSEDYPELKADKQFTQLQNELVEMEDRIQAARRTYNFAVKVLKNRQQMFPSNIIASRMKISDYDMFAATATEIEKTHYTKAL